MLVCSLLELPNSDHIDKQTHRCTELVELWGLGAV